MSAHLVVGCDGTDGARAALEEAVRLATEIGGSIVAAYAYDKILSGGELRDLDQAIEERGNALLDEAREYVQSAGLECALEFREGGPAQVLVSVADQYDARYIVVGSYGERPIKGALVGSTPYRLLHLTERPVIVVRIPES